MVGVSSQCSRQWLKKNEKGHLSSKMLERFFGFTSLLDGFTPFTHFLNQSSPKCQEIMWEYNTGLDNRTGYGRAGTRLLLCGELMDQ